MDEYIEELTDLQTDVVDRVVRIADKHHEDRDEAFAMVVATLLHLCDIGTLREYETQ